MTAVAERPPLQQETEETPPGHSPLDPITGQPHLTLPLEFEARTLEESWPTYHHSWYYRRDSALGGGEWPDDPWKAPLDQLAGLFLRMSVGEDLMRSTHTVFHHRTRFPRGPVLPTMLDEKFRKGVTGLAGIVPRRVIDLSQPRGEELVDVDDETFARVANSDRVGLEHFQKPDISSRARNIMGVFLLRHALNQDLSRVDDKLFSDFKLHKKHTRRLDVTREVVASCLEIAIEPFNEDLERLRENGYVQHDRRDPLTELLAVIPDDAYPRLMGRLDNEIRLMYSRTRDEREARNRERREENRLLDAQRKAARRAGLVLLDQQG